MNVKSHSVTYEVIFLCIYISFVSTCYCGDDHHRYHLHDDSDVVLTWNHYLAIISLDLHP